jgi:hypothetical protein
MVLAIGFLLLVSLALTAFLSGLTQYLSTLIGVAAVAAHLLDILISFAFVTLLFALIYKYLPDVRIQWKDVWVGAALTSLLFTIGKVLIGLYLGSSGVTSAFGAAGSLITVCFALGLLLVLDILSWSRIHSDICHPIWLRSGSRRKCRKRRQDQARSNSRVATTRKMHCMSHHRFCSSQAILWPPLLRMY